MPVISTSSIKTRHGKWAGYACCCTTPSLHIRSQLSIADERKRRDEMSVMGYQCTHRKEAASRPKFDGRATFYFSWTVVVLDFDCIFDRSKDPQRAVLPVWTNEGSIIISEDCCIISARYCTVLSRYFVQLVHDEGSRGVWSRVRYLADITHFTFPTKDWL